MKPEADCEHPSLYFGSGNYYVFCRDCPASWVHRDAQCDIRTARKALEHGFMTIRTRTVRDRLDAAITKHRALVKHYSKEHYP